MTGLICIVLSMIGVCLLILYVKFDNIIYNIYACLCFLVIWHIQIISGIPTKSIMTPEDWVALKIGIVFIILCDSMIAVLITRVINEWLEMRNDF